VIDLYGNPRSALIAGWTGAPVRVGPARRARRRLYTHLVPAATEPLSAVKHHFRALSALGVPGSPRPPRIHLSDAEREFGRTLLRERLPGPGPTVGLHVGNRWQAKRWPESSFASLLRVLSKQGVNVAVLAGPGEEPLASRVARSGPPGSTALVGGLSLRSYWSVVAALDVLVTNDGSPLHAGPAVGTPTVGILGATVPEIWFPYDPRDGHQLLCREIWCRPCHRHECARLDCLEWITVDEAARAVERARSYVEARRAVA
jgi:ADP-heptose:LPS heptosyltransferase